MIRSRLLPLGASLALFALTVNGGGLLAAVMTVTNTSDSGAGSLRDAITLANGTVGADTIEFAIPGAGPHTIAPLSVLPIITDTVTINGYTQSGASVNTNTVASLLGSNAMLMIEINGAAAGGSPGLQINASTSAVRGLVVNRFSGNGIELRGAGNQVDGNFIGTDVAGTSDLGNGSGIFGHFIGSAGGHTIGGTTAAARNVISGNSTGITLFSSGNFIQGNLIGTNAAGTAALGNGGGLSIVSGANNNQVGDSGAGERNIISGNGTNGVSFTNSPSNRVQGNYIGTDVSGTLDVGNGVNGVSFNVSSGNTVGGTLPGEGNVISGNNQDGVNIGNAAGNMVLGNFIGTKADGVTPLGNSGDGVEIFITSGNTVGSTAGGGGNLIAFNGANGVRVATSGGFVANNNAVRANSIYLNTRLGIDLIKNFAPFDPANGVTPNDAGDPDINPGAPNNLQNYPVLTLATFNTVFTHIEGTIDSLTTSSLYPLILDFFDNAAADPSGFGEGQTYLGSLSVAAPGNFAVNLFFPSTLVTATATDANGNTSEFSQTVSVVEVSPVPEPETLVLAAVGLLSLGVVAWRKRRTRLTFRR